MVRIIKRPEQRNYKVKCWCGCTFSFQDEDTETVEFTEWANWRENKVMRKSVKCPICENYLNLEKYDIEEMEV